VPTERYRFREEILRDAARRTRRRLALTLLATGAIVVAVWATALRAQGAGAGTLVFSLALLSALAAVSMRRRMGRLHARWASFEVRLDDDAVVREVVGVAPVRIARGDVLAVEERPEGLVVRGRSGAALLVPRELDGYARAREALARWAPGPALPT
jgi:hypothetical protein